MKYQTISMKQFRAKGAIYYVAIATVTFSHVKITCYVMLCYVIFTCEDIMFSRESSPAISLVFI